MNVIHPWRAQNVSIGQHRMDLKLILYGILIQCNGLKCCFFGQKPKMLLIRYEYARDFMTKFEMKALIFMR